MKVYLLIVGDNIKGFSSLSRLCKEVDLNKNIIKNCLPFKMGNLRIVEVDVDERV